MLIIIDKPRLTKHDYDEVAFPVRELGWELGETINPILYTESQWNDSSYTPFYKNVMKEGVVL